MPPLPNPFVFGDGQRAYTVRELWTGAARAPRDALYHLREGHFAAWLDYAGHRRLAAEAERIRQSDLADAQAYRAFMRAIGQRAPCLPPARPGAGDAVARLLAAAARVDPGARPPLVDAFVAETGPHFPYVAGERATFIALNPWAGQVQVAGDLPGNCWANPGLALTRLAGTGFWYRPCPLPADARVDYKLIVDGTWTLDPMNPGRIAEGGGENSELQMPGYRASRAPIPRPGVPSGQLHWYHGFYSHVLQNHRDVAVYLPAGYPGHGRYPTLYVHDGLDYLHLGGLVPALDNLIADGAVQPLIAVLVPPGDRAREYTGDQVPGLETFLIRELLPVIDGQFATDGANPDRRGTLGVSYGAYFSLRLAYDRPGHFRRAGGQSTSFASRLVPDYAGCPPQGQHLCLATGTLCDTAGPSDRLAAALLQRGYAHRYLRSNEGHSWGLWRGQLEAVLTYLWPARPA